MGALPSRDRRREASSRRGKAPGIGHEEGWLQVVGTLDDVAAASGVSRSTVSRVINGGSVSEATRRQGAGSHG